MILINPSTKKELKLTGSQYTDDAGNVFPIINGVIRIVQQSNYSDNFGFQWNKFAKTQIDRERRQSKFTHDRFFTETNWEVGSLEGKKVLEAGCGAGRFTQVFLDFTKGNLYSFDYSDSVSANYRNNGHHGKRLNIFQASIYEMPFPDNSFDKIFCFGVLQFTPDFKQSIKSLVDKAKPGSEIVVDFFAVNGWWTKIHAKYFMQPFTSKMPHEKLLRKIENNIDWLIKAHNFFNKIGIGRIVNRFLPICDMKGTFPDNLTKEEQREWAIMDTFNMLSPKHEHPEKPSNVVKWFKEFGTDITFSGVVSYANNIKANVVRAVKK